MTVVINGTTGISTPGLSNSSTTTNTGNVTNSGTVTNASTISVGNATPAASGAGITFPATQSASTDANTLDDYEEGTWTPSLGGNTTYTIQAGTYTKIGRQVIAYFDILVSSIGTGTTSQFTGLPFTSASSIGTDGMSGCVGYLGSSATNIVSTYVRVDRNSTIAYVWSLTGAGTTLSAQAIFGNGTRLTGVVTYVTT